MLKLTLVDGEVEITQAISGMSRKVREALADGADEVVELTMTDIHQVDFELIREYCEHHKFEKAEGQFLSPLPKKTLEGNVPDAWERKFISKLDRDQIVSLF